MLLQANQTEIIYDMSVKNIVIHHTNFPHVFFGQINNTAVNPDNVG